MLRILGGEKQADAAESTGAGADSIRKYRPLVDMVLGTGTAAAIVGGAAAVVGPLAAGVVGGTLAAVVLPPCIKALPNVSNVRLASESKYADGHIYRVWSATVRLPDGTLHERETQPVWHEQPLPAEPADVARKREHREHDRNVRALRALDAEASAAHRAKDRERKRVKAAQRASQLPELPVPDGDLAWLLPDAEQPHFKGEHVWYTPQDGAAAQHAVVQQLYRDGSGDLRLVSCGTMIKAAPHDRLVRVGIKIASYVGQIVEVEAAGWGSDRKLANVTAVNHVENGSKLPCTVDVQLFDESTRSYSGQVLTRLHVCNAKSRERDPVNFHIKDPRYAPRIGIMRDLAWSLCNQPLSDREDDVESEAEIGESDAESGAMSDVECCAMSLVDSSGDELLQSNSNDNKENCGGNEPGGELPPSWVTAKMNSATTPAQRARLADHSRQGPGWVGPGNGVSIANSSGPQLYRAPGRPCCKRTGCPSLCGVLETHHFDSMDHPPSIDGQKYPYIAVAEAERLLEWI